jgi:hypothetical protein
LQRSRAGAAAGVGAHCFVTTPARPNPRPAPSSACAPPRSSAAGTARALGRALLRAQSLPIAAAGTPTAAPAAAGAPAASPSGASTPGRRPAALRRLGTAGAGGGGMPLDAVAETLGRAEAGEAAAPPLAGGPAAPAAAPPARSLSDVLRRGLAEAGVERASAPAAPAYVAAEAPRPQVAAAATGAPADGLPRYSSVGPATPSAACSHQQEQQQQQQQQQQQEPDLLPPPGLPHLRIPGHEPGLAGGTSAPGERLHGAACFVLARALCGLTSLPAPDALRSAHCPSARPLPLPHTPSPAQPRLPCRPSGRREPTTSRSGPSSCPTSVRGAGPPHGARTPARVGRHPRSAPARRHPARAGPAPRPRCAARPPRLPPPPPFPADTPRLFWPAGTGGFLAKVRWYSFTFLVEQLEEEYGQLLARRGPFGGGAALWWRRSRCGPAGCRGGAPPTPSSLRHRCPSSSILTLHAFPPARSLEALLPLLPGYEACQ